MNFLAKYKKIFLIIGFIAIVFILGYALYIFFFKPALPEEPAKEPGAAVTPEGLPISPEGPGQVVAPRELEGLPTEAEVERAISETAKGGLTQTNQLNNAASISPTLNANGRDVQFYSKDDGKFYRLDKNGELYALTDKIFYSVEKVTWSPNKNKAVLEYPDGANIIYNFTTKKQITLPKHWKDFNFSPSGQKLVMKSMGLDPDNRWLAIVNDDGSRARRIEALGDKDSTVYPSWSPNNQTIAMYTEGVDFDRQEVFFVGLNNENFKSTIVEGRDFRPKWSPKGEQLLYSVYSSKNDLKPSLWVVNARGESIGSGRKNLGLETWADKCAFVNSIEVYCAAPENLEAGAGLFPEMAKNTRDRLYKINIRTGAKKLMAIPDNSYNISNPIVTKNGQYLYFTDATTERIYKIKLK